MKSEIEIAREVIAGKWGIGEDRKNRITKAGYDYNVVQAMVNQMLNSGKQIGEITINADEYCGYVINVKTGG